MPSKKALGLYIRLSSEDDDLHKSGKAESNSVSNQRMLLLDYYRRSPDLQEYQLVEFCDDGFSGTNFDRPRFKDMMQLVRRRNIHAIMVKDLSRFGRDYLEVGVYLEMILPLFGIRFISVNDQFDSNDYVGTTGGVDLALRNLINGLYSRDLSAKIKSANRTRNRRGEYWGGDAFYGYILDPKDKHRLMVDTNVSDIIVRIFQECIAGNSDSQIAKGLNDDGISSPAKYKHRKGILYNGRIVDNASIWTNSTISRILKDERYTGKMITHKRETDGITAGRMIPVPKEAWIVVPNTHEAIVSKEEFELAQAVIRGGEKNPKRNLRYYPLKGLVCCGNCKRALTRRKLRNEGGYFYQCTYSTHDRDTECPVGERYSEAWIEDTAYKAIGQMLTLVEKKAVKEHEISKRRKSAITECADAIRDLQKQYERLKAVKLRLYEKYTSGSITKAEYLKRKAETDAKMSENEEAIQQGHQRMQELDSEHPCSDERLDAVLGEYQKGEGLTYELAHALISAIYVHGHDSIEIVWKFKDIFEDAEI